jgi:hypothetical protein
VQRESAFAVAIGGKADIAPVLQKVRDFGLVSSANIMSAFGGKADMAFVSVSINV